MFRDLINLISNIYKLYILIEPHTCEFVHKGTNTFLYFIFELRLYLIIKINFYFSEKFLTLNLKKKKPHYTHETHVVRLILDNIIIDL